MTWSAFRAYVPARGVVRDGMAVVTGISCTGVTNPYDLLHPDALETKRHNLHQRRSRRARATRGLAHPRASPCASSRYPAAPWRCVRSRCWGGLPAGVRRRLPCRRMAPVPRQMPRRQRLGRWQRSRGGGCARRRQRWRQARRRRRRRTSCPKRSYGNLHAQESLTLTTFCTLTLSRQRHDLHHRHTTTSSA